MNSSNDKRTSKPLTYRDAGVDIDAGNRVVDRIKPLAARTFRPEVLTGLGGFGALFELPLDRYRRPVLVSGTDGVGTKLKLAQVMARHDTIGIDLVAMCVNDVLAQGAESLFFLDYFATGKLSEDVTVDVVSGIARGCELAGCALIGGETAEMPDMYPAGEYDLAGFCVGVVERDRLIDGSGIKTGDVLLGIGSSGAHSNGYSLIRRILERSGSSLDSAFDGATLGERLLEPTRIYVKPILELLQRFSIGGLAHITGGGLSENIVRVLPDALGIDVDASSWPKTALFDWLQREGQVSDEEMWRTFNCGIGMVLVVPESEAEACLKALSEFDLDAWQIGVVRPAGDQRVVISG